MAKPFDCGTCNKCCYDLTLNVSLGDIDRMATYVGLDPAKIMNDWLIPISSRSDKSLFTLRKDADGRCIHLNAENRCGIHPGRPWVCATYRCDQDPGFEKGDIGIQWGAVYNDIEGRSDLLHMIHARTVTETYIARNGSQYNPTDYAVCMSDLTALIAGTQDDRIRVARDDEDQTVAMTYNCNKCNARENCCNHAAATLDDIRVAADACGQTAVAFWKDHVSDEPSPHDANMFTFQQLDHGKCEFLDVATHRCGLGDNQPGNCAYAPCPKLATAKTYEQYFIAGGSVHDQYRLQVATSVTRQYISQCGVAFHERFYERCIAMIDDLSSKPDYYRDFLEAVREHRYINEEDELKPVGPTTVNAS